MITETTDPEGLVSNYGDGWRFTGVLTEHLYRVAPGRVRNFASGRQVVVADSGHAYFTCCSELIEISTEDGPMSGRCGGPVFGGDWACPGHQQQINGWRSQGEAETMEWEQGLERAG